MDTSPSENIFTDFKVDSARKQWGRGRAAKRCREAELERTYAQHMIGLLRLERDKEEALARDRMEQWSQARLQAAGLALFDLDCRRQRGDFYGRPVVRLSAAVGGELPFHKFRAGDLVLLSSSIMVEGVVLKPHQLYLEVVVSSDESAPFTKKTRWRLDQYYSARSYERMEAAVAAVTAHTSGYRQSRRLDLEDDVALELRRVLTRSFCADETWLELANGASSGLCRRVPSEPASRAAVRSVCSELDPTQTLAAARALRRRVSLVQGPPGTGKTLVAAAVAAAAVRLRDAELTKRERKAVRACETWRHKRRVLACAASNVAADNLLARLLELQVSAVRLGHPASTRSELRNATLDARVNACLKSERASSTKAYRAELARRVLREADVVVASCVGAGADALAPFLVAAGPHAAAKSWSRGDDDLRFGLVLIDEAAQATEPCCLVPMAAALGASQLVLVGDQMQLPPTVVSRRANALGLGRSLFARLVDAGLQPSLLTRQYRMHPAINAYSSMRFYASRVMTCPKIAKDRLSAIPPAGFEWPRPCQPLAFLAVHGGHEHTTSAGSFLNPAEVAIAATIVNDLLHPGDLEPSEIAVVTPYAAQARAMFDAIHHDIEIGTVDGLQGREKDVVLVSAVRSNDRRAVGFLADFRRLNVALTRAKRALVVIGDPSTLSADPHWRAFIYHCRTLRCTRPFPSPPASACPPV